MADEVCANCNKTAEAKGVPELKRCSKCKTTKYCHRDCQKAHWKVHKKQCSKNAAEAFASHAEHSENYSAARLKDIEKHVPNPFTRLDQGKYLHDRPEKDVFKLLIDSFRMREADDAKFDGEIGIDSVYNGAESSEEPFRRYLDEAAEIPNLLPPWWNDDKVEECVEFGHSKAWSNLTKTTDKEDIVKHYGDQKMPMQLRMLAEAVYGSGPMGQDGTSMRKMMAQMESGGGPGHFSMMNMANLM